MGEGVQPGVQAAVQAAVEHLEALGASISQVSLREYCDKGDNHRTSLC